MEYAPLNDDSLSLSLSLSPHLRAITRSNLTCSNQIESRYLFSNVNVLNKLGTGEAKKKNGMKNSNKSVRLKNIGLKEPVTNWSNDEYSAKRCYFRNGESAVKVATRCVTGLTITLWRLDKIH